MPTQSPAPDEAEVDVVRSVRPASPPPTPPAKKLQKEAPETAWSKVARRKLPAKRKVDKNVLSARGGLSSAPASAKPSPPSSDSSLSGEEQFDDAMEAGAAERSPLPTDRPSTNFKPKKRSLPWSLPRPSSYQRVRRPSPA